MTPSEALPDVYIKLDRATIDFQLFSASGRSLKNAILRRSVGGQIATDASGHATSVKALDNVSLMLGPGTRLGLVGRNGAGKTTLLRALAGIYEPTAGTITVKGSCASMTDLTMGMDGDATGRENIFLRGVYLGLTFAEARSIEADILDFSQLGEFIDLPVRTYSSGMLLRLAFAVSTCIRPDILVMDEVIGVGDQDFFERAEKRLNALIDKTQVFVVASHDNDIIRRFCTRVIVLDHGSIAFDGDVEGGLAYYDANIRGKEPPRPSA